MEAVEPPAAWVISKPRGTEVRAASRLFVRVSRARAGMPLLNVPHLTLEILYPPLPDLESLKRAIGQVARRSAPCRVPALGVARDESGSVSIELALTPELAALRRALADALCQVGSRPYPGLVEDWRPHLSVIGREEPASRGQVRVEPDPAVAGYHFPVDSLTLSLPAGASGRFRELGPYRLGEVNVSSTRR